MKFANERVGIQDLEKVLLNLKYTTATSSLGEDNKTGIELSMKKTAQGWETFNRHYFIHPHALKELNLATRSLPVNTGFEKVEIQEGLLEKLEIFFNDPTTPLC
ncbi:hypothetical protein GU926_11050 [Nibribacter ruber]|uniref:Uncharacterized protein n=1 Tax=Nibribacter ruber TaxID=2698458 RepID=A0A6P1P018_9BACT|nr:hypothetical protein [Nibribacter ruber]QHL87939.1 hypothetical protein GU926_11050 [Nibribacter ruber]